MVVNGREVGESGILAGIAGSFETPVVLVSGDRAACDELTDLLGPSLATAPVKSGLDRYATRTLPPADARDLIERTSASAMAEPQKWPAPWRPEPSVRIEVEFATPDAAAEVAQRPGVDRRGPRSVCAVAPSFWEAWRCLWPPLD